MSQPTQEEMDGKYLRFYMLAVDNITFGLSANVFMQSTEKLSRCLTTREKVKLTQTRLAACFAR